MTIALTRFFQFKIIVLAVLLCAIETVGAAEIIVNGIEGDLKKNVELTIGKPVNESDKAIANYLARINSLATQALQAKGYYNSKISHQRKLQFTAQKPVNIIEIEVEPGPPVKIRNLSINIQGDAQDDKTFKDLIQELPIQVGDRLDHGTYEQAKNVFLDIAQDRGYFDGKFVQNTVAVDKLRNKADVTLTYDTGVRYRIGEVKISSDRFNNEFLTRWIPFDIGVAYQSALVAQLAQQFQASGYFSRVRVNTLFEQRNEGLVPLAVDLQATDRNQIGVGFGFATDTGPRTKLTWRRPHHNDRGHSVDTALGISEIRQQSTIQYKIPRRRKPLTDYWLIDAGALNEQNEDAESQLRTLDFQRVRETPRAWQESVFIRWEREKFEAAEQKDTINLVLPGISWARTRSKGGLDPYWGNHFSIQVLGGHSRFFSDISVLKSVLSFKWLRSLAPAHKFIFGLDYGAIYASDFDRLPTSHRFYVGGDRSIRGFRYNTVSPENDDGDLTGGRFKEVASVEYDYRFRENWSLALFVDAGRAFDQIDERYRVGTGFGVRWHSPVGPLRLDLGFGVSEESVPILLHLSIGPDL